jgi:putative transposase
VKYAFMLANRGIFRVNSMCRVLDVSRAGYYSWTKRQQNPSGRQQRREALDQQVKDAFAAGKEPLRVAAVNPGS